MATLSVLYFFDVKEDQEQVFIENWTNLTALIYEYQGSLGSRLHKTEDGRYYGYAMWPNKELWEQDWSNMPHKAKKYRDAKENYPEAKVVIFEKSKYELKIKFYFRLYLLFQKSI